MWSQMGTVVEQMDRSNTYLHVFEFISPCSLPHLHFPQCYLSERKQTLTPKKDGFCSRFLPVKESFSFLQLPLCWLSRTTNLHSLDQQV